MMVMMMGAAFIRFCCACLVLCLSTTNARPWPAPEDMLVRRQDSSSSPPASPSPSPSRNIASVTSSSSSPSSTTEAAVSGSITPQPSASGSRRASSSSGDDDSAAATSSTASGEGGERSRGNSSARFPISGNRTVTGAPSSTVDIDERDPPGGIQMITPGPFAGPQYYKIGDFVTFGWNYTSLSVTPSAINVVASCSLNSQIYTIAANESVQSSQAVTWDTGAEATASAPLPMETYTLIVYDADASITDPPRPGYLAPFSNFRFAMYSPKPYVAVSGNKCASCSGAPGADTTRQAARFLLGMAAVTMLSFTWFVSGSLGRL